MWQTPFWCITSVHVTLQYDLVVLLYQSWSLALRPGGATMTLQKYWLCEAARFKKKEEKKPHFLTHGLFLVLAASSAHQSLSFPPDCLFTSSVVVYPRCLFFFFLLSPLSSILSRSRSLICRADHIRLSVIIAGLQPLDIKQPSPHPLPIVLPPWSWPLGASRLTYSVCRVITEPSHRTWYQRQLVSQTKSRGARSCLWAGRDLRHGHCLSSKSNLLWNVSRGGRITAVTAEIIMELQHKTGICWKQEKTIRLFHQ